MQLSKIKRLCREYKKRNENQMRFIKNELVEWRDEEEKRREVLNKQIHKINIIFSFGLFDRICFLFNRNHMKKKAEKVESL